MPRDRQPRVEEKPCRRHQHADREDAADADPRHEVLRDRGHRDDRERERQVRRAGLQRGVVQNLLHVQREQEELREDGRTREKRGHVRARQRAQPEDPHRQERCGRPQLDDHEGGDERRRCGEQAGGGGRCPAMLARPGQRVDEQHEAARDRAGSGRVEVAMIEIRAALAQQQRRQNEHDRARRHVDEEDPRPAERARQQAAEQHARGCTASRDGAPDAEREIPLRALLERRRQDRQRGRSEKRRAEPLQRAKGDQRAFGPGEPVQEGADGEEHEAGHEHAPSAEQVGGTAAQEQDAAEEDGVGGDHPLQPLLAEVQIGLDRRQRHVHDGDVEHDHELSGHEDRQCEPALAVRDSLLRHSLSSRIVVCIHDIRKERSCGTLIPQ